MTHPKAGEYEHYKGKRYAVIGIARHSETLEELVVYQALYGSRGLWVRPLGVFLEHVEVQGRRVPRFRYVGPLAVAGGRTSVIRRFDLRWTRVSCPANVVLATLAELELPKS